MLTSSISRMTALVFSILLFLLAGCGGGGGSGAGADPDAGADDGTFGATFSVASASVAGVEGSAQPLQLTALLTYTGTAALYLAADYDAALVLDVQGTVVDDKLDMTVTMRGDVAVGTHAGKILLHACLDEACIREAAGSPVSLPLQYVVKPNIQVASALVLSRTGSEAAPTRSLSVGVLAEAGKLGLSVANNSPEAIDVTFDGEQLLVETRQVPAGDYTAKVTLTSASDPRYAKTVEVRYTVHAPAGGEHALSVDDAVRSVFVEQGKDSVQRLVVTRPTWTSDFDPPRIDDPNHILTLVDRGHDQYDATLASQGFAVGESPSATITFSAGPTGGETVVRLTLSVGSAFYVEATSTRALSANSTAADLDWTSRVLTFDGIAAKWSAVSLSPWVRLQQSSGRTGVDPLKFTIDAAALSGSDPLIFPVRVSIDRPGTSPLTATFYVTDQIPRLQQPSPATLVASSGRVYINGRFSDDAGGLLSGNHLRVTGATLVGAQLVADKRLAAGVVVLAVDLADLAPGATATIGVDSPLVPTEVRVRGQAPLRAPAAYQALGLASHRPGQFAPGLGALYFSGNGTAFRWGFDGTRWALSQSAVPGLIDIAPAPDDATLYATDPTHTLTLDPVTLARRSTTLLQGPPLSTTVFDANARTDARALTFSADGRAFGSLSTANSAARHGVGWICSTLDFSVQLESSPGPCDPGPRQAEMPTMPMGFGLLRSANGHFIVGLGPNGERSLYQHGTRSWVEAPNLPTGLTLVAASDAGTRLVRSDGMLLGVNDVQLGGLGSVVPFTHVAAGYGISSGGRFGFVYGYRLEGSGAAQTASDPTLWVIDMNAAGSAGLGAAPVIAAIPLPQAVGCTGTLAKGETCRHTASIAIAPGDGMAFILGPRGVVALPLPATVNSALATGAAVPRDRISSRATRWAPAALPAERARSTFPSGA